MNNQSKCNQETILSANERANVLNEFFIKIGLYANLKGYDYLIAAVEEVLSNPMCIHSLARDLYPKIAEQFDTTFGGVERNIRNAIEIAYNRGKLSKVANVYYGGNFMPYEKPTNSEFISFLVGIVQSAKFSRK